VAESEIKSFTSKKRRGSERQTGHTHARANTATQENRKRKNTKHSIPSSSITYEIHPRDRSQPPSSARCVACNVACGSRRAASPRSVSNVRARSRVAVGGRRGLARFQPGMHTQRHTTRARLNEVCRLAPLLALVAAPLPEASLSPVKHSLPNYSPQRAPWSARMGYLSREGGEGCSTPPGRVVALLLTDRAVEV
jgi:hypothetical protein